MKKILLILVSMCYSLVPASTAQANWYEVTGTSTVVLSEEMAKLHALEDAIYRAVSFSGADIGSISNIRPLLHAEKKEYQFANSEIRYILVDRYITRNKIMYAHIHIDIYPSATGCHFDQYKKTTLLSNIDVVSPQQAVMGQIYEVGDDFTKIIDNQLNDQSMSFISVGTTDYAISKDDPTRIQMISQDTGAQYLISGEITDLTATIDKKILQDDVINRQFAVDIQVYDGKTGHEIFSKKYREVAMWTFAKTSKIDTKSARFWASTYGDMLLRVSRNIMLDLESELACKITLPQVVAKFGDKVTIDLGRVHGVKTGDKLRLWHTSSFIDQNGLPRTKVSQTNITLTVSRVYDKGAELTIDQQDMASSVQIGDVMNKQI
ncbi:flagellar assembly protein FlgT [Vibrio sp. S4M6]|uniref:flagellar assembly protein FlgT n=1 Tax=Vibrio sinus TaxID=2946865 RepID=UPI002029B593|nr:flagellar assembly protein FlgT [Vibrio sinus]MCL9783915.1 flagellar assembly protein FlgT [Vibrio sinus]